MLALFPIIAYMTVQWWTLKKLLTSNASNQNNCSNYDQFWQNIRVIFVCLFILFICIYIYMYIYICIYIYIFFFFLTENGPLHINVLHVNFYQDVKMKSQYRENQCTKCCMSTKVGNFNVYFFFNSIALWGGSRVVVIWTKMIVLMGQRKWLKRKKGNKIYATPFPPKYTRTCLRTSFTQLIQY